MPFALPAWLTRPYSIVAGCAICSGLAVSLIEDVRHYVFSAAYTLVFPEPTCVETQLDSLGDPAPGVYRIILTNLANDGTDLTQTRRLDYVLREKLFGDGEDAVIQYAAVDCVIYATSGYGDQRRKDAEALSRSIAERSKADVVLWGEVVPGDAEIALRMTHATDTAKATYSVETSTLTKDFGQDIGALIAARMLTLVDLAPGEEGTWLVPRMQRVIGLTQALTEGFPDQMTDADRASLFLVYGTATYLVGSQAGDMPLLETAVTSFEAAVDAAQHRSDSWALIKVRLGNALLVLGQRTPDTSRLERSVEAYRDALDVWSRTVNPEGWAGAQNNLGNALRLIADRNPQEADRLLAEAVAAYESALLEWTREGDPLNWALVQTNLGTAFRNIGQRTDGTSELEQSVAAYQNALTIRRPETVPIDWAMTQNNLGAALLSLAEREAGTARLDRARVAFTAALTVQRRDQVPVDWGFTQGNLAGLGIAMFDKTGDPVHLAMARDHAMAASAAFAQAGADRYVAMAEVQLALIDAREAP